MSFDVQAYLAGKGYRGRPASGGRELMYACFFDCEEPADSRKKKLYVNAEEGLYTCKVCGASGGSFTLQRHFGDDPKSGTTDDAFTRRRILDWAAQVGATMLANRDDVMLYLFNERGLDPQTIVDRQIGFVGDGWSLTGSLPEEFTRDQLLTTGLVWKDGAKKGNDYFYRHLLIPVMVRGHVVQIRGRVWGESKGGKYLSGPGEVVRAYNIDSLDGADEVILTEGEFDAVRLHEVLRGSDDARAKRLAVVGLPGTNAWPEDLDDYLSIVRRGVEGGIKRIYIGFDSDEPGRVAAEKLREKFGTRARILTLPNIDGRKADFSEWLLPKQEGRNWGVEHPYAGHTAADVLRLMSAAAGKRIFSVGESGASFREYRSQNAGLQTGWHELDSVLHPGLLPGQVVFLLAKTGTGKGHIADQSVPTPSGFRKWGDLCVGDEVFGSDGRPTAITGVYDRGAQPTYTVHFSDGAKVRVDGDHLWSVRQRGGHGMDWQTSTMSTTALVVSDLHHGQGWRFTIPMAAPAAYPHADLPVEPYTLGALLANGYLTGSGTVLTTPDPEVVDRVAQHYDIRPHRYGTCPRYGIQGLIGTLRELGVATASAEKFIPEAYLTASIEQRIAILQGLMDGDGTTSRPGSAACRYSTSSRDLARDVVELVRSLGGTAMPRWYQRPGRAEECTISIVLPRHISPFHCTRKKGRYEPVQSTRIPRRAITAIEPDEDASIRCISVAAPDQLYLVGREYVVTHNTLLLCNLAYQMRQHKILFISLEMTREEVYHRLERIYLFHHPHASIAELEEALSRVWICDENRLGEKDIAALVSEFQVETGEKPDVVFVDYLGYYARGAKGNSPYEKVTAASMQLKADAKSARLVVVAPTQVNRMAKDGKPIDLDDARDSGAIEETGDFVLAAFKPDNALAADGVLNARPTNKIKLSVLKSRHGGVGKVISLQMDQLTLAIVEDGTRAAKRAEEHNLLAWRGHTWEALRIEETRPRQLTLGKVIR